MVRTGGNQSEACRSVSLRFIAFLTVQLVGLDAMGRAIATLPYYTVTGISARVSPQRRPTAKHLRRQ